jgi:hypothetical protein
MEMTKRAITTSGLYSLSVGKVRSLVIPLPPEPEQRRIVAKVDQLMSLCDDLEANLKQSQAGSERLLAAAVHHLLKPSAGESRCSPAPKGPTKPAQGNALGIESHPTHGSPERAKYA